MGHNRHRSVTLNGGGTATTRVREFSTNVNEHRYSFCHGRHTNRRSPRRGRPARWRITGDEAGSSLILALVYIVSISLIVGALADWTMNDLTNTTHFKNASQLDYAVSSAAEVAVQSIRYAPLLGPNDTQYPTSGTVSYCWSPPDGSSTSNLPTNGYDITVWCSETQNLASSATRVVTIYACESSVSASACVSGDLLTAEVTFDDYPPGGAATLTQTCTAGVCGQGATTNEWEWTQ